MATSTKDKVSGVVGDNELTRLLSQLNLDGLTVADLIAPCSNKEAAALLDISPGTLKNLRVRGEGPPNWAIIPGIGGRYRSKLDVLNWFRDQLRKATTERSQREVA